MTPEQRNFLMEIERRGAPVGYLCTYVDSLLAAERAAVVTAMLEYLPANSHEKITADVLRKLGEKRE